MKDKLESQEFYELMQRYRHANTIRPGLVNERYEAVKTFIREHSEEPEQEIYGDGYDSTILTADTSIVDKIYDELHKEDIAEKGDITTLAKNQKDVDPQISEMVNDNIDSLIDSQPVPEQEEEKSCLNCGNVLLGEDDPCLVEECHLQSSWKPKQGEQEEKQDCPNCGGLGFIERFLNFVRCPRCHPKPQDKPKEWEKILLTELFELGDVAEACQNNTNGLQLCLDKIASNKNDIDKIIERQCNIVFGRLVKAELKITELEKQIKVLQDNKPMV